jgi:hypothetical protein
MDQNRGRISALVVNEPYLSGSGNIGKALKERGWLKCLRLAAAALLDKVRGCESSL